MVVRQEECPRVSLLMLFVPFIFRDKDDPSFWFRGGISLVRDL